MSVPTVPDFFTGQHILITGATGFMGKVLIEKILRSCPGVGAIYILVRPKKGMSPAERWNKIASLPVFDKLKKEQPENINKVVVIEGDITTKNLGLSEIDYKLLIENITVIFHAAATVLFFDSLYQALKINLKGTLEIAKLAKNIPNLTCFCHVSTAFSNCDRYFTIEEKVYEPIQDWRHLLHAMETNSAFDLCCLTSKILSGHPNTYTLTKSLGEQVMAEFSKYYPVVILRPSVVVNAFKEPIEGWLDNLHGPSIIGALVCSGILRVQSVNSTGSLDYVAVDFAINGFLAATWDMGIRGTDSGLEVYSCGFGDKLRTTAHDFEKYGLEVNEIDPMGNVLWYPFLISTTNDFVYHVLFFLLQICPAIIVDSILFLLRRKPILLKITKKIAVANQVYKFFMLNFFYFPNCNYISLQKKLTSDDSKTFFMIPEDYTDRDSVLICALGVKKFILHEKEENLPQRRKNYWRMYWIDRATRGILLLLLCWYPLKKVSEYFNLLE